MNVFEYIESNYNYYPRTCIELSILAYEWEHEIGKSVSNKTNLSVCWGPVELTHSLGLVSYSKMFVAKNAATNEYFVAIQGTNPFSSTAWKTEDFDIRTSQPFSNLLLPAVSEAQKALVSATENALLSQGTFNGVSDLKKLVDKKTGKNLTDFLIAENPSYIYVTGHSLGGTLAPVFYAYINAIVYGGAPITNMALWTFAGLTPGGAGFNAYFNSLLPNNQDFQWRIQNSLDVAPLLWENEAGATDIYVNEGLNCDPSSTEKLVEYFSEALESGVGYEQPQAGLVIPGEYEPGLSWFKEASHQHSSLTYQSMIGQYYTLNG